MNSWREIRLGHILRLVERTGFPDAELLSVYREHGVVRKRDRTDNFNRPGSDLGRYQWVSQHDLVVNRMKAWQGSLGVSPYDGIVSPDYYVARIDRSVADPRFLHHAVRSAPFVAAFGAVSTGIRSNQWRLPWTGLRAVTIRLPELAHQRLIADFLDRECQRIAAANRAFERTATTVDELVRTQFEHLADRLRASGAPQPLKRLVSITGGFAFDSASFVTEPELGVSLIRGTNVGVGILRSDDTVYWPHDRVAAVRHFLLREGDLLVGLNRPWIAGGLRSARVEARDLPALLLQRVACLRPIDADVVDLAFVQLLLNTNRFRYEVGDASAVTFPMLEPDRLMSWPIPVPPIEEQRKIVAAGAEDALRASRVASLCSAARARLDEYRDALIAEAITGQLDVTGTSESQMDERAQAAVGGAIAGDRIPEPMR